MNSVSATVLWEDWRTGETQSMSASRLMDDREVDELLDAARAVSTSTGVIVAASTLTFERSATAHNPIAERMVVAILPASNAENGGTEQ